MLAVVAGHHGRSERQIAHSLPLLVGANAIDLLNHPYQNRVFGGLGQQHVKGRICSGKFYHVIVAVFHLEQK